MNIKMNKKLIYNNIMKNVATIIKQRLNEEFKDLDESVDNILSDATLTQIIKCLNKIGYPGNNCYVKVSDIYDAVDSLNLDSSDYDFMDLIYSELRNYGYDAVDDDLIASDGEPGNYWLKEEEYEFDDVNESANDIYDDDEIFMFDEDKEDDIEFEEENEFYDNQGNWDPVNHIEEYRDLQNAICDKMSDLTVGDNIDFIESDGFPFVLTSIDSETGDSLSIDKIIYDFGDVNLQLSDGKEISIYDINDEDDLNSILDAIEEHM